MPVELGENVIEIGDYIRWWVESDFPGMKKSYAGIVIKEHPGWIYYYTVACIDGKERYFKITTVTDNYGSTVYEPEYINYTKEIGY